MRALLSLAKLARRVPSSLAALHAPRPLLLRQIHSDPPPPVPPQAPPPIPSLTLESDLSPSASAEPEPEQPASDPFLDDFLARFVAALRPVLTAAFPTHPRPVIDEMIRLVAEAAMCPIVGADPGPNPVELSDDLWATVWELSSSVRDAMRRDQVRADLRKYLHSDEVKKMTQFAEEIGVRGTMLRELRFKWAREKLEEVEFYRELDERYAASKASGHPVALPPPGLAALPQRKGEIKYSIYGLNLSDPKWAEVVKRTSEAEVHLVPKEAKAVEGKARKAEERLLAVDPRKGDPAPAMDEWKEEQRPKRADWTALLERVKARSVELYLKVAEIVLVEGSFSATIRDYSNLIDLYSKANHVEDAERILGKMKEKGIEPDILTTIILFHMYSRAGKYEQAKEAFSFIQQEGFPPNLKLFSSMISVYINTGKPEEAHDLLKQLDKPTSEMYVDVMRALAEHGLVQRVEEVKIDMGMKGYKFPLEVFRIIIQAHLRNGNHERAVFMFNQIRNHGHEPDDPCIADLITAYMQNNHLDKALNLLVDLEKKGLIPGVKTNIVLLDWLSKLQLEQEAEQLVQKIKKAGEEPLEIHVFLADMYAKSKQEERARKSLKILEEKKTLLKSEQFERIITGLIAGGFSKEANKYLKLMKSCGFVSSGTIEVQVKASSFGLRGKSRG